jgi:DNA-binding MarR family transcriptional regulator
MSVKLSTDQRSLGDVLLDVSEVMRGVFDTACAAEGLSIVEGRTLRFIARGAEQSRLAALLSCGAPRVTALLNQLEGRELVSRRRSNGDHRRREVVLTQRGRDALVRVHERLDTASPFMTRLDDAQRRTLESLLRLLDDDRSSS